MRPPPQTTGIEVFDHAPAAGGIVEVSRFGGSGRKRSPASRDAAKLPLPITAGIIDYEDGRVKATEETPGEVLWREPGIPHELLNVSDWQYRKY